MNTVYHFVTGPMLWISFGLFCGGCLYKIMRLFWLTHKKEPFIFSIISFRYGLRSIFHWITPFAAVNMRKQPLMTIVTFVFHFCLLVAPLFLLSHVVLFDESWDLRWWTLPDPLGDAMAVAVMAACLYFLVRRIKKPEVRFVTTISDYAILAVVAAPFITGFWAYHQFPGYPGALILHVVSGEIMLIAIPFTRLRHMILAVFTRAYMGSEFGAIRHARDW